MGTTSEKLTYLNETKQLLKNKINNLGGSIDDNTTFRQYANQLQNVYDNLPKTSFQEGTEVTIENGLKGKLDFDEGKVGFGQASQESTQGYNLLPTQNTQTVGGVKLTKNDDGTFDLIGNNTSENYVEFLLDITDVSLIDFSQNYYTMVTNQTGFIIQIALYNGNTWISTPFGRTATESALSKTTGSYITQTYNKIRYLIRVPASTNINLKNVYIMIYKGAYDSSKTYEQYSGGYASPSPNWEQEVKCVRGKNLAHIEAEGKYRQYNSGTLVPNSDFNSYIANVQPNTTYITNCKNIASQYPKISNLCFFNSQMQYLSGLTYNTNDKVFTTPNNCYYVTMAVNVSLEEIQTEEGTQATPYLPYNTIQETIRGINFFEAKMATDTSGGVTVTNNNDGTFTLNGTATGNLTFRLDQLSRNSQDNLKTYENGTYTLSIGNSKSGLGMAMMQIDTYRTFMYVGSGSSLVSRTLTNATNMFIYLDITSGTQFSNFVVKPMLVKGTYTAETLPNFEPYVTPRTYQFSLGDYKFYGIGTYRDYILRTTGKNLWGGIGTFNNANLAKTNADGTIDINITNSAITSAVTSQAVSYELTKVLKRGTYTFTAENLISNMFCQIVKVNSETSGEVFKTISTVTTSQTFTITEDMTYFVRVQAEEGTTFNGTIMPMIEQGSTASDYQPYGVGNWYKFEKIGFYKITGQETIDEDSVNDRFAFNNLVDILHLQARQQTYCNRFEYIASGNADYGMFAYWNGAITQVFVYDKDYTDPSDLQNYFANNETYFLYIRNKPILTPITGTLAEQLEEWYYGQSLDGTTIIEGNGDLPMIIKVRALKGE